MTEEKGGLLGQLLQSMQPVIYLIKQIQLLRLSYNIHVHYPEQNLI